MAAAARADSARPRSAELAARRRRFALNVAVALAGGAVLWALPEMGLQPSTLRIYALTMLFAVAVMGLNLVFGMAGQITLGPAAVFAVGAYASGLLSAKQGWSPLVAIVAGTAIAGIAGGLIGLPALRVGGFYLGMVTAFAALAVPAAVLVWDEHTGGEDGLLVPGLRFSGGALNTLDDDQAFRLIVVVLLVSAFLVGNIARSAWGRWFRCLAASPVGASSLGISVYGCRVYAFLLSAVFGGLAGGVYAHYQNVISPLEFGFDLSLGLFAAAVIGGLGTLWGPVLGAMFYFLGPRYLLPDGVSAGWTQVIYGSLLIVLMILVPAGLVEALRDLARRLSRLVGIGSRAGASAAPVSAERTSDALPVLLGRASENEEASLVLRAEDVTKDFGGVRALDGADVDVWAGRITALIGPNGSGKTTLLNVCSGFVKPDAGRVLLGGVDISGAAAHKRPRLGLARTFQQPIVFRSLNGAQNVMAGYSRRRPDPVSAMLSLPSSTRHEREAALRAEACMDALGVAHLSQKPAAQATLAEARILDLARALVLDPVVLLLDEPAAGLDLDEIAVLEAMVRAARAAGVAVLLVEHDVGFVTRLADHVTVLDRGRVIANGNPEFVRNDDAVKAAYFGDVELEDAIVG